MDVPSTPTASPAAVNGRHVARAGVRKTIAVATSQASAPIAMTGHGSSNTAGSGGGSMVSPGSSDIVINIPVKCLSGDSMLT